MDPTLVRGTKCKGDFANEDTINHHDDEDKPWLVTKPPLKPRINSESFEESQESLLRLRADVLEYQGLCLQYQASILEKQARTMGDIQEDNYYTDNIEHNNGVGDKDQKYVNTDFKHIRKAEHIKSESKYQSDYKAHYGTEHNLSLDHRNKYELYKEYDMERYQGHGTPHTCNSHLRKYTSTGHEDVWMRPYEYTIRDDKHTTRDNEYTTKYNEYTAKDNVCTTKDNVCTTRDNEYTTKDDKYATRDNKCAKRDNEYTIQDNEYTKKENEYTTRDNEFTTWKRSTEFFSNSASFCSPHHGINRIFPRTAPLDKCQLKDDWQPTGPLDLSIKKTTPSPKLHTQVHTMPRIFFRL